jgi:hypothetical protein
MEIGENDDAELTNQQTNTNTVDMNDCQPEVICQLLAFSASHYVYRPTTHRPLPPRLTLEKAIATATGRRWLLLLGDRGAEVVGWGGEK